jgi:hypothetical protein
MLAPPHLAQIGRLSRGHGGQQFADAKNIERPSQIIDEGGQTELGADFFEAAHEEGALVHPLFDGAEGVLNDFAAAIENVWPGRHALGHAIERVLVVETGNRANVVRALRAQRAIATGFWVTVVSLFEVAQPAISDRRQRLPGRTDIRVAPAS